jgi:hypothetical protein
MRKYQFSHASFQVPTEDHYVQAAEAFITEMAPSLPDSVRSRVATLCAAAMFSEERVSAESIMKDPSLRLCQTWLWPEANAAYPFSLEYRDYWAHGWHLWQSEQWHAKSDADQLIKEATDTKFDVWLYNVPMTLVRQWRDKLMPAREKRGRKYDLLFELKRHPEFPAEAAREFAEWKMALLTEAKALMEVANRPPVPTHLSWLVKQVLRYLDNYHTATNSWRGPGAFAARRQALIDAASRSAPPLDEPALHRELGDAFSFVSRHTAMVDYSRTVQLAWGYIETARPLATPKGIAAAIDKYAPGKLICAKPCARCAANVTKKKRTVAPYDVLCTCDEFLWVPKSFKGSKHEWKFGQRMDMDAMIWAFDRLLSIDNAPLDRVALSVRSQSSIYDDDDYRRMQLLLEAGKQKAQEHMQRQDGVAVLR